ncbi:methyl-accepting chemotaxis protein [Bradyrhizobium sp. LM2.7]
MPFKFKLRIRGRLISGFLAVCAIIALSVGYTVFAVGGISTTVDRMVNLRTPVALASTELVGNLYSTLATLRGYLLTGNPQGKLDRAAMWKEMDATVAGFDEKAGHFTNPENSRKWAEAKVLLAEFRAAQDKAEAVAFTSEAYPATKLLVAEAGPRAETIFSEITRMINEEDGLEATAERKRLLKAMADTRGNFAAATAQLRMYLLSGEKNDKERFFKPWALFEDGYTAVSAKKYLLTPSQLLSFEKITKARGEFVPLYEKMFMFRESADWNAPVHILVTEAAPRAVKILDLLDGPKGADGTRSGGIKTNQNRMLAGESHQVQTSITFLKLVLWGLLAAGLGLGAAIALLTARAIARPIQGMTAAMGRLAGGDTSTEVPGMGRADEVGEMAEAVQVFKDNMIETDRLRAEQAQSEARVAAQRKTDMHQLAGRFEDAVGEIIETLSSSSTELEAAAKTLSRTAESTQQRSGMVVAASEEASTNVSIGCFRHRRDELISPRNQPSGAGCSQDCRRGGGSGTKNERSRQQAVAGGNPHRRRGRTDQYDRGADQPFGPERNDRSGAGRRGGTRLRCRCFRSQGARRTDREGDWGDQPPDHRYTDGYPGFRRRDQGNQRHDRSDLGNLFRHCGRGGRTGNGYAGDIAQRPTGRARYPRGRRQYHRGAAGGHGNRLCLESGACLGANAVE